MLEEDVEGLCALLLLWAFFLDPITTSFGSIEGSIKLLLLDDYYLEERPLDEPASLPNCNGAG